MNFVPKINRRSFFIGTAAVGGGMALGLDFAVGPQCGPRRRRLAGGGRLGRDPAGRHRGHPHRPLRNGPGHADRPRPARRRRTGVRLVEGHDRISDARPERRAQARLGRFSTGGSRGIRESQKYVREGGAAARMMLIQAAANEWKVPASECTASNSMVTHSVRPEDHLRQGRRGRGQARRAEGDRAQGPEGLEDRRQAAAAARHRRQGRRQDGVRHRRQAAGNAQRLDQAVPGVRRQGEELRRRQGREDAGREEGRAGRRQRGRRRRRHLLAGQDRARRAADRLGHRRQREGPTAPRSPSSSRPASMPDSRRSSATRTATSKPPSPARRRRSRRSTPIRTRTTRRWSR